MVRNFVMIIAAVVVVAVAAGWSHDARAIGLGEIQLKSVLNQPLSAEIELLEVGTLSRTEIIARLASGADFERLGLERFFFLSNLNFSIETRPNGRSFIHVTSSEPITEPFLNFLVELRWPQGRMLKEYTVLVDPPTYTAQAAPPVTAPERTPASDETAGRIDRGEDAATTRTETEQRGTHVTLAPTVPPAAARVPSQAERLGDGRYGTTDRDDTLWSIASRSRASRDISVEQQMLAIVELNPEAFIGGNVNLLKAGHVLRLPGEVEVRAMSRADAVAEVAVQHEAWQAWRAGEPLSTASAQARDAASATPSAAQVDATPAPETAAAPRRTGADGELRIVAGDGNGQGAAAGSPDSEVVSALELQLASSEEERERMLRENRELASRVERLVERSESAQRQLEVRDAQFAQLQQQYEQLQQQAQAAPPASSAGGTGGTTGNGGGAGGGDPSAPAGAILGVAASSWGMIAAAAAVLLLAVWMLFVRGRNRTATAETLAPLAEPRLAAATAGGGGFGAPVFDDDEDEAQALLDVGTDDARGALATEGGDDGLDPQAPQTSDVIAEADIYIAYNRYPQAITLLESALGDAPGRSDVRLKLLEVHAETRNEAEFERQLNELMAHSDDEDVLLAARELGTRFSSDEPPAAAAGAGAATADAVGLDDFELALDDDAATVVGAGDDPAAGAELDLDLDTPPRADALRVPEAAADRGSRPGDELGGDLGIDFDPDARPARAARSEAAADAPAAAQSGADDFDFDLEDLRLDDDGASPASADANGDAVPLPDVDDGDDGDDLPTLVDTVAAPESGTAEAREDAFDFLDDEDAASTKLDLARAYIDMGDNDGAREILGEVLSEGNDDQKQRANALLQELS